MTLGQSAAGTLYSASQLRMAVMHTLDDWREHIDQPVSRRQPSLRGPRG